MRLRKVIYAGSIIEKEGHAVKKILTILITLLIGAALAAGGIFYFHMKAQPQVSAKGLMERLEESSELTVEKSYYTGIVKFEEGTIPLISKNSFNMKYEAEIDAGFELEGVEIEVTDDAVVVNVPEARILSVNIDPNSLEFYDNKVSLIKTDRKEATKQALQEAQKDAEKHAESKGLLTEANKRADVIFRGILEGGVGNREIIVNVGTPVGSDAAEPADDAAENADAAESADAAGAETEDASNEG